MSKFFYAVAVMGLLTSSVAFAETVAAKTVDLKGYVVDNACAGENKDKLAEFVKGHPKTCMLKGPCAASGYSIFSDGKLEKFSKDSAAQIMAFLGKEDSKTAVEVTAEDNSGELKLVSIKNQ